MKINKKNIKFILISLFLITLDWVRWDLIRLVNNQGFNFVLGMIIYFLILVYFILLISSFARLIIKYKFEHKIEYIPFISMLMVLLYYLIINNSMMYVDLNYYLNKKDRIEIINMYEHSELTQVNVNKYIVPYRFSSHNKIAYIKTEDDTVLAVFFINSGYRYDGVIVYVSNDNFISKEFDTSWELDNIKRLENRWYFAKLKK